MTPTASHRFLAIGLLAACISLPGLFVLLPALNSFLDVRAEIVSAEARLHALQKRHVDLSELHARKTTLGSDTLAGHGAVIAGSAKEASATLVATLRGFPTAGDAPEVTALAAVQDGDWLAVRARYVQTLPVGDFERVVATIDAATPLLFAEEIRVRRLRDADTTGGTLHLSATLRAYAAVQSPGGAEN